MTNAETGLMEAAGRLFRGRGYEGTTVREIAAAAGMLPGSLHYRFRSKEQLLVELMERGMTHAIASVRASAAQAAGPLEAVHRALATHMSLLVSGDDAIYVNLYEFRSLRGDDRARIVRLRDAYEALWDGLLHRAAGAGLLRDDVDLRALRFLLLGAVNWSAQWFRPDGTRSADDVARTFVTMAVVGCQSVRPAE